jgi:hypothetical protein
MTPMVLLQRPHAQPSPPHVHARPCLPAAPSPCEPCTKAVPTQPMNTSPRALNLLGTTCHHPATCSSRLNVTPEDQGRGAGPGGMVHEGRHRRRAAMVLRRPQLRGTTGAAAKRAGAAPQLQHEKKTCDRGPGEPSRERGARARGPRSFCRTAGRRRCGARPPRRGALFQRSCGRWGAFRAAGRGRGAVASLRVLGPSIGGAGLRAGGWPRARPGPCSAAPKPIRAVQPLRSALGPPSRRAGGAGGAAAAPGGARGRGRALNRECVKGSCPQGQARKGPYKQRRAHGRRARRPTPQGDGRGRTG